MTLEIQRIDGQRVRKSDRNSWNNVVASSIFSSVKLNNKTPEKINFVNNFRPVVPLA